MNMLNPAEVVVAQEIVDGVEDKEVPTVSIVEIAMREEKSCACICEYNA